MVSIDFFTVPTITLKVVFVFVVLEHRRREVLHFNVTEHPTAAWASQQIVKAFGERDAPRYLIRDQDSIYGKEVGLDKQCPFPRALSSIGKITEIPHLGRLHHRYERIAP